VTAHQQLSLIIRNQAKLMSVPETVPAVEVRRLLEENARLRSLLIAHSMPIPEAARPTLHPPQASNAAPEGRKPGITTAEQRTALFHSLFRGCEDARFFASVPAHIASVERNFGNLVRVSIVQCSPPLFLRPLLRLKRSAKRFPSRREAPQN
jgi:hypothetical protein